MRCVKRNTQKIQSCSGQQFNYMVVIRLRIRPADVFVTEVNNNRLVVDNAIVLHDRYLQARVVEYILERGMSPL